MTKDAIKWHCHTRLDKFEGASTNDEDLIETVEIDGNAAMYGGISTMWEALLGGTITSFAEANAAIGVGNSTAAEDPTHTNLQGTSKFRKAVDLTYPQHTDGTALVNSQVTFRSTFEPDDANFAWDEWGIFNSDVDAAGTMLNRKVENLGTKTSGFTWRLTLVVSIA